MPTHERGGGCILNNIMYTVVNHDKYVIYDYYHTYLVYLLTYTWQYLRKRRPCCCWRFCYCYHNRYYLSCLRCSAVCATLYGYNTSVSVNVCLSTMAPLYLLVRRAQEIIVMISLHVRKTSGRSTKKKSSGYYITFALRHRYRTYGLSPRAAISLLSPVPFVASFSSSRSPLLATSKRKSLVDSHLHLL
jgi:hypothetical protein